MLFRSHSDRESAMIPVQSKYKIIFTGGVREHENTAESKIRRIKESMRSILSTLPYDLPAFLLSYLLQHTIILHNHRINTSSQPLTPFEIIMGIKITDNQLINSRFGRAVYVNKGETNNSLESRIVSGIVVGHEPLNPNNIRIYIPESDSMVTRNACTDIPDPTALYRVLNEMAIKQQGSPEVDIIGLLDEELDDQEVENVVDSIDYKIGRAHV